jgi:nucleoside-diphosphate-sugar epimerase
MSSDKVELASIRQMWETKQELLAYVDEHGMRITIVRPPLVYGPGHAVAMAE